MTVFKIPESLYPKYHGAGHALAASASGQLVDLVYIEDVIPEYDSEGAHDLHAAITDDRLGQTVRYLQSLGEVHVGMCSCYEFVEM